jgi:hypothetical protein
MMFRREAIPPTNKSALSRYARYPAYHCGENSARRPIRDLPRGDYRRGGTRVKLRIRMRRCIRVCNSTPEYLKRITGGRRGRRTRNRARRAPAASPRLFSRRASISAAFSAALRIKRRNKWDKAGSARVNRPSPRP